MRSFKRAHARRQAKQARRATVLARRSFLVAGSAMGASALLASGAQAAGVTYTVTSSGDGPVAACDPTTHNCVDLRDAIAAADADATATDTNTITFASTLTGGNTIKLAGAQGPLAINGAANLVITGPGASSLTITNDTTANTNDLIHDTEANTLSVTISGITLTGGGGTSGSPQAGGAIELSASGSSKYATGGLFLNNDVISNNASASSDGGGAIYGNGPLSISGTTISGNTASDGDGGGIYSREPLTISGNSHITGNTASGFGGGVFSEMSLYASTSLSASTVSGNTAAAGGGVATIDDDFTATLSITNGSSIANNKAVGSTSTGAEYSNAYGGGVLLLGGALKLTGSTVSGNTATPVAGKTDMGGGILAEPKYPSTIANSMITGNTATDHGGGLAVQSFLSKYTTVARSGSLTVRGTTISGNTAPNGAGVELGTLFPGSDVTFNGSTISGNTGGANSFGGGLLIDGGPKHQPPPSAPSALHPQSGGLDSTVRLLDSTISGNTASTGAGVSIGDAGHYQLFPTYQGNANPGSIAFDNSTIGGNAASSSAGGIYLGQYATGTTVQSGSAALNSTIVSGNTSAGSANDLTRGAGSTTGGFAGAFSLVQAPGTGLLTGTTNITGKDPQLAALASNGGPTQTLMPGPLSPVIDQGKAFAGLTTDQIGNPRTVVNTGFTDPFGGDGTDIGSVELASSAVGPPPQNGTTGQSGPTGPTGPTGAKLSATVRGTLIGGGATPLVVGNTSLVNCSVNSGTISSCVIEIRANGALLASGEVTGTGAASLSTNVQPTTAGASLLAKNPLGVAATASVVASATGSPSVTGPVVLLGGPSITLPTGTRSTKLPAALVTELNSVAKLITGASSATCTAYTSQQPKHKKKHKGKKGKAHDAKAKASDTSITKSQSKAACSTLVTDGFKGTTKAVGAGHSKPIASNKTAAGRKKNQRLVISFTGL